MTPPRPDARRALLDVSLRLFRETGYAATTVDDLCRAAGVTKGAFFHHFTSKEALGVAAIAHWSEVTGALFAAADYHRHADPVDRVLAYLDLRAQLVHGSAAEYSCVAGTLAQEIHASHPALRDAADASIRGGAAHIEAHLEEALARHPVPGVTAASLALHVQAVIQGAFVVGKARNDATVVTESIAQLRRYVAMLFGREGGAAGAARTGVLIYAKQLDVVSAFYERVLGARVVHADGELQVLQSPDGQLIIHAIPPQVAASIDVAVPPAPRQEQAIKPFFTVERLDEAERTAAACGGTVFGPVWDAPGMRVRNVCDPEGNIIHLRERVVAASPRERPARSPR